MLPDKSNQITAIIISSSHLTPSWAQETIFIPPQRDSAQTRNQALKEATTRWVIFLKETEEVSQDLVSEINTFINLADQQGYTGGQILIKNFFLGKIINHGRWSGQINLRLGRRVGQWQEENGQLYWQFPGQKKVFSQIIVNRPHQNLAQLLADINKQTSQDASQKQQQGKKTNLGAIIFSPQVNFYKTFFFQAGFVDGLTGFILAIIEAFGVYLQKAKLWLLNYQAKQNSKKKINKDYN